MEQYAYMIMMVLPGDRTSYYRTSDIAAMRSSIFDYVNELTQKVGFYPLQSKTELLESMALYNFGLLFIGLVFDIVLILFVIISVLLIYSLLMITTETKTFDTGVMRLLGLTSYGFVAMIMTQGVMFVVPSIIAAYVSSFPTLLLIYSKIFDGDLSKGGVTIVPSAVATIEAVGIGLLIPTLSAIIPIQRALSKSLSESLNTARSTLSGTIVILTDKNIKVVPYIIFGLLCVTFGVTVYVILPQALLAENAGLILQIFFAILGCLILGLVLLTANLRGAIEKVVVYVLFFWEKRSLRRILKKNLVAHKHTNKLTSIIYALTLGCVIFLCVSLNLILKTINGSNGGTKIGSDISVFGDEDWEDQSYGYFYPFHTDPVLLQYQDKIKNFGYTTVNSISGSSYSVYNSLFDSGKQAGKSALIYGI